MDYLSNQHLPTPALAAALRRSFDAAAAARLTQLYGWVAQHGGLAEDTPRRTPATSFNPRPARIALIALKEVVEVSEVELAALLLSTATYQGAPPSGFDEAAQIATALRPGSAQQLQQSMLPLAACIVLDAVRHLHLTDGEHSASVLAAARHICAVGMQEHRTVRLSQLLEHAITQQATLQKARGAE